MLQGLQTIGLSAVMTGMDNVRNMTGSPIAGIDPHELLDVRPLNYGALFLCLPSSSLDLAQSAACRDPLLVLCCGLCKLGLTVQRPPLTSLAYSTCRTFDSAAL